MLQAWGGGGGEGEPINLFRIYVSVYSANIFKNLCHGRFMVNWEY